MRVWGLFSSGGESDLRGSKTSPTSMSEKSAREGKTGTGSRSGKDIIFAKTTTHKAKRKRQGEKTDNAAREGKCLNQKRKAPAQ